MQPSTSFYYYYILFIGFCSGEWDVNEGWPVINYSEKKKKGNTGTHYLRMAHVLIVIGVMVLSLGH